MQISLNTSKWWQNAWAALIFFTRLPFWRLYQPPKEAYKAVVEYWPLVGWLTGSIMAAIIYFGSMVMPHGIAILTAIVARIIITGALHEDGLTDFIDGFGGGGTDRQRILDIMKDSRIGTYGMLGILLYMLLLYSTLSSLPVPLAAITVLAADPYAKMIAAQIIEMMPYARTEEESKAKNIYRRFKTGAGISLAIQGLLPLSIFFIYTRGVVDWQYVVFVPCIVMYFMYLLIWKRLRGYTGDCCGALFLIIELSLYLTVSILWFALMRSTDSDTNQIIYNLFYKN